LWLPVVFGPLAPYAAGYRAWLLERGYAGRAVVNRLELLGLLSRWLESEGVPASGLTPVQAERFLESRRAAGYSRCASAASKLLPLGYLRELEVVPAPVVVEAVGPVERLLADYRRYLFHERGLGERIVLDTYLPTARLFLSDRQQLDGLALAELSAGDVSVFLARELPKRGVDRARHVASGLRCLCATCGWPA
jgi:integrase/recombinase XerD